MPSLKKLFAWTMISGLLLNCGEKIQLESYHFDPEKGKVIVEPEGNERGYWAGAPGIYYDEGTKIFYLTYRLHTHETYPDTKIMKRGHIARIASSLNGIDFTTIKEFRNEDFGASSLGRASIVKCSDGMYRYFMCHDNLEESQWTIGMIESPAIEDLNALNLKPVFTSGSATQESLRDPYTFFHDGIYYLLVTIEKINWGNQADSSDYEKKYQGVTVKRSTGLATSSDGVNFKWIGEVFKLPATGWDSDCRRITSVKVCGNKFVAYYDGSSGYENNHEDFCALAIGEKMTDLNPVDPNTFLIKSPYGTGSCRFADVANVKSNTFIYYECSREDDSHDLRVVIK